MLSDANKGISAVEYNHLNMPTKITVTGANAGVLDYKYSANGIKLQKIKTQGGSTTTTDYIGNYVYENGIIKQITHPEGYVEPDGAGWQYVYRLTDIWGNTRITFADDNNNGSVNSSEIRREQNFYPFGLEHKGYNGASYGAKNNLKTYQKQEFTEDLGLNTHEWRYRVSDPSIGRFWQVDPLAEDYMYNSTYAFQENKMGMGIELEGLELIRFVDLGQLYKQDLELEGVEAANRNLRGNQQAASDGAVTGLAIVATAAIPGPEDVAIAGFAATKIGGAILKAGDKIGGFLKGLFKNSDNVVKSFDDLSDIGKIDPSNVKFSQGSISKNFKDGGSVEDLTKGLKDGSISPDDIPAIRVVEKDGKIFTLDNRRLKAFQDAGVEINYKKLDEIPKNEQFKFKDYNSGKTDGSSVIVRGSN